MHRKAFRILLPIVAIGTLIDYRVSADTIATDSFDYSGTMNGKNGGSGAWNGAWVSAITPPQAAVPVTPLSLTVGSTVISGGDSAVRIDSQNAVDLMVRPIQTQNSTLYFSFLLRYEGSSWAGGTSTPDFLAVWFDDSATSVGNTSRSTATPNLGLIDNDSTSNDFFARDGTNFIRTGGALVANQTYLIAGALGKTGALTSAYNTLQLWVWKDGASFSPAPITIATNVVNITHIGVRTANLDAGADTIWIDEFKLGTQLSDVAPVPLPAPALAVAAILGGIGLARRKRSLPL
ncbi:MAG TPA: hypothetical protein VEA69_07475 [Tepidisphaeraceae bacterium]|nr:hypothetical protein [Tepidisphaeraceae bacterium]